MILLTFQTDEGLFLGIKTEKGVLDVKAAATALNVAVPDTPAAFYAQGMAALPVLEDLVVLALLSPECASCLRDESTLIYGPCVPNSEKILCVGLNYRRHAAESGAKVPEVPVFFSKFNNALAAHGDAIPIPRGVVQIDYEVELAAIIGKPAKYVSEDEALDYVLGYCTANDVSARELQMRTSQWLLGKTSDRFCPLGPYLVTADEVGDPQALFTKSWLNGELRQNSNTADMVFTVAQIISYASQYMTLKPGDVILTGTPEGVILGMKEKVWMKPGDEITVEVEKLGKLTNRLVEG
ncbi:MAG TPA: fumarylacetoacetate hydrolase family protein [Anaerolineae bacterium]|nr:fumarylacetoacetate hydrolase family protein [Anaerolineae bacterium]HQI86791.1 fumarylacetoacetate hydrolase family protein [Anaerolineae bacterium]